MEKNPDQDFFRNQLKLFKGVFFHKKNKKYREGIVDKVMRHPEKKIQMIFYENNRFSI